MHLRKPALILAATAFLGVTCALAAAPPEEIRIAGERVFPESLTSGPDGSVYVGGAGSRMIYRAAPGESEARPWILPAPDNAGFLGVFADAAGRTLWACTRPGPVPGAAAPTASSLRAFDLATGVQKASYAFPTAGGTCNDIAVGRDGAVYATDTPNMEIVRLRRGARSLEVWAGGGGFGPNGGVLDGIAVLGNRVIVNTLATGKLWSVPIASKGAAGAITEVQLDKPVDRPDGMRSFGSKALLVAESGNGGRLSKVTLNGNTATREVLKEGYPDGPVAVTVVGETAYLLEGQLALMRSTDPNARAKPFRATAVAVGKQP